MTGKSIAVVGAGIGGVAVAVACARRGASVTVLEQAPELAEVGAGLQISANGMCVLRALGVVSGEPVDAVRSAGTQICDYRAGRLVSEMPPPAAGPTWYFHRADLLAILAQSARDAGVEFRLGQRIETVDKETGQFDLAGERYDLVIAADGGQSRLRNILNGPATPKFSHQVAWRAIVPSDRAHPNTAVLSMGPGQHVVTYPLRQGRLTNIVAIEERSDWTDEGWTHPGDPNEMRRHFAGFGGPVRDLLARVDKAHIWALHLHAVADHWHRGRLALLGDAAHPTLPFMAQGACLALEDAWALAACYEVAGQDGLARYQQMRRDRARRIVEIAAGNARRFHLRGPMRFAAQAGLRLIGPQMARRLSWIYNYDVTAIMPAQASSSTQTGT